MENEHAGNKEYDVLGVIGSGSFGLIRKVIRKRDNKVMVRKEIHYLKMSEREKQQLTQEVNILAGLRHPNIVRYYSREIAKEEGMVYLYMEYCHNGDLGSVIKHCKKTGEFLPEKLVWSILTQLVLALHYCHTGGADPPYLEGSLSATSENSSGSTKQLSHIVLHRDLKPENIFLDENNAIKLGDFGLSRTLSTQELAFAQTYVGTPYYMSPEIISSLPYTQASDIWALGCVLYELCAHAPPFTAKSQMALFQKIKEGVILPLPRDRKTGARLYGMELEEVVRACLRSNPDSRPSAEDILGCDQIAAVRRQREIDSLHAELRLQHMSLSTRETTIQARETMLLSRETALAEREARLIDRENRLVGKEKWAADLLEREKLIHERERIIHEREQRLERIIREQEMKMEIDTFPAPMSPPARRPLQESSGNRVEVPRFAGSSVPCAAYPHPEYNEYASSIASENLTVNIPPLPALPKTPSRLQTAAATLLSPRRRRTTLGLGSPVRETNPTLSPAKSHTNLRAANGTQHAHSASPGGHAHTASNGATVNNLHVTDNRATVELPVLIRRNTSTVASRAEKAGGMIKVAARNTFRGRENEIVDWDRECETHPEVEMPSPFIRRKGVSTRISGGFSRH